MRWKSIHDFLLESEDHKLIRLCILAPLLGLIWIGGWAALLVGSYYGIRAIAWWTENAYQSPETWLIWIAAPCILLGLLSFIWHMLDTEILPWLERVMESRRKRRL